MAVLNWVISLTCLRFKYDTFSGQINKKGKVSASMELDILGVVVDRSEVYNLSGQIDEKIWGDSPREDFFRVYMTLLKE